MNPLSWPETVLVELTPDCNNHCTGCGNVYAGKRKQEHVLPTEQWIDWIHDFGPEVAHIRLSGGEPTLHPGFEAILDTATSFDAWVTVNTNGQWRKREHIIQVIRRRPHLAGLLISLHGHTPAIHEAFTKTPGSFDRTLASIRAALDTGLNVAISCVITRQNWFAIADMIALSQKLGVQNITFNRFIGSDSPDLTVPFDMLRSAIAAIKQGVQIGANPIIGAGVPKCFELANSARCPAGITSVTISPSGMVRPCAHVAQVLGSLFYHKFYEIWHSPELMAWRNWISESCQACKAQTTCRGGCRAYLDYGYELHDPLFCSPLKDYQATSVITTFPNHVYPRLALRMRRESFGYALLGAGKLLAVGFDTETLLQACDGLTSYADLVQQFGPRGSHLLSELWQNGLLQIEPMPL